MEVITIRDGIVTLTEEQVVRRVGLQVFKDRLAIGLKVQTPVLPRGAVLYSAKGNKSVIVLEEPPQMRTITFRSQRGSTREFTIPLPWVYFFPIFHNNALEELYLYFSRQCIQHAGESLCFPTLPNTFDECRVCLGDYRYSVTQSLASRIADISRYYWESTFNLDASNLYSNRMPEAIVSATPDGAELFEGWSTVTLSRVTELTWQVHDRVDRILARLLP